LLLTAVGCRAGRLTEPLERENRHLEDVIYELEDQLREMQAQLDSCHRENAALRSQLGGSGTSTRRSRESAGIEPPLTELGEPSALPLPRRSTAPLEAAPPYQGPPLISPPSSDRPDGLLPQGPVEEWPGPAELDEPETIAPASANLPLEPRADEAGTGGPVTKITLNKQLTGGHNRDDFPGDDGVMVVIEPRTAQNQIVRVPGELSIVILDPALEGADSRVARWDFSAEETARLFKKTLLGEGIHLALPWPGPPPANSKLVLFVRYRGPDGEERIAEQPIRVKPPLPGHGRTRASGETSETASATVRPASNWQSTRRATAAEVETAPTPTDDAAGWKGAR
jgi:hypothetical protein